ncbi:terpenoid cyclases/protein prenyltransferase alpha-alpha toroid [Lophiotrema nucula]|uniref:Protein farnesyltransferase subunit beta n=1 Tax=Lophiotrema nucula TaxID=690887 RepID=A0A6A5Z9Y7_9PLEO|nr:terpenoid cyclases/protein prenyltransferase alpha-alpha toroid [Lophiotrema nucula]
MASAQDPTSQTPSSRLEETLSTSARVEELSDSDYEEMETLTRHEEANQAYLKSITSPIEDLLDTASSEVQDETLRAVMPFLIGNPNDFDLNSYGLPTLQREKHVKFLKQSLGPFPPQFAAMDASRPWVVYWCMQGLTALGQDISEYSDRVVSTFSSAQHPEGGFGGGHGQLPHLAATYAAILSLVIVGTEEAYASINRQTMYSYLGRMKQVDGGFTMSPNGEEDIRGAFCALVALSLLNLPLELPPDAPARQHGLTSFLDNLGEWVSRCQTYEGGISAAPGNEAHGAYAFCGLGCLSIMGPPKDTINKWLDVPALINWLNSRQSCPEGGFHGRGNKLVDGCYSHWVGGCWALVEAAAGKGIWNRAALGRYILSAAQFKKGGLVDKPGKRPDAYHTCYNLAGLSWAQYDWKYEKSEGERGELDAPYHWQLDGEYTEDVVWDNGDMVNRVHPVFVVPFGKAESCRKWFEEQTWSSKGTG